ncbi:MAG: pyruvate dehydrogenase (acetyl-transferring), homodimeric type, partial [Bryobacteraceae bacterium]
MIETTSTPEVLTHEDPNPLETSEWLEAFDQILEDAGSPRAAFLLGRLTDYAAQYGVTVRQLLNTPYINTIPVDEELPYPGDRQLERAIKSLIRWNAMCMVVRANKYDSGIGGHISTYASLATLEEVGHNHFFHAKYGGQPGDFVFFQGHASPGVYARAFLEGRLSEEHLKHFRHETRDDHPGLSSYPHPWLMPDFWQFPTVSMGLGPLNAIYQARFMKYLENRGIIPETPRHVWAFVGDGETDEVETLGALKLAAREKLDNLIFVVNCNLQRLDGPVNGNGRIVDELERIFRGAGWNVLKVVWGDTWDPLFAADKSGLLMKRMEECVDGEYQAFKAKGGAYTRKEFFGKYPELAKLVEHLSDEEIAHLRRGGHDPVKVYNAYLRAIQHKGSPTVVLAKTVKGYGLGEAGEGRNPAHQQKKLTDKELHFVKERFEIPVPDGTIEHMDFFRPKEDSPEMKYIRGRLEAMGGSLPARNPVAAHFKVPPLEALAESIGGSQGREVSTTMAYVRILTLLLKDHEVGKYIVPIVPDEARTFGMESLFRQVGIYASQGQLYSPVDSNVFLYYKEAKDGQILEEGITEAGAMGSFTAAGTSYATYGVPMIPFFSYYSMFGFQRIGDMIWAFADSRGKGFLMGGTGGRTTLSGEGLQHCDGHSIVLSSTVPTCHTYDPAFAYEMAVVIQDGIRRMYEAMEDRFYYIMMYNENYAQPAMPEGVQEGILRGIYRYKQAEGGEAQINLFGSGTILNEALRAKQILAEKYQVRADVWSVTSYNELRRDALEVERWNRLHPAETPRTPYILEALKGVDGPIVASSDYMKIVPDQLAPWLPNRLVSLGTDGFGRSDNRESLRKFFENGAEAIAGAALSRLARDGKFDTAKAVEAINELGLRPES